MDPEFIDWKFATVASVILFAIFIVWSTAVLWKPKVDNYFAGRRHKRRERNRREKEQMQARMYMYSEHDYQDTKRLFDINNPGLARKI